MRLPGDQRDAQLAALCSFGRVFWKVAKFVFFRTFTCASFARFLRVDEARVNAPYLYWFLQHLYQIGEMERHQVQHTGIARFQFTRFSEQIQVPVPARPEQRAIAHILGTLDDKIELNRRMNQTLEEMARALFKSWFVDFDPVRAKATLKHHDTCATPPQGGSDWSVERARAYLDRMDPNIAVLFPDRFVDSELGPIPAGWEVKALGHFGEIITGKTPSTRRPEYYGEDVPFLRIPDMHRKMYALETELMLSMQGANSQPQKTLPPGSISVSCIATLGLVVLNHHRTQTNQQINSIIPYSELVSRYIFWTCRHLSSQIETGGLGGSVFGNMNKSTFAALRAVYPGSATVSAYDSLISPLHASILANDKQAHILAAQRDALLPKLVSGEVRAL